MHSLKFFLVGEMLIGSALLNAGLNAFIAWMMFGANGTLPIWGLESVIGDLWGTTVILVFLTTVICTHITLKRREKDNFNAEYFYGHTISDQRWLLHQKPSIRGIFLVLICAVLFFSPLALGIWATGVSEMNVLNYVALKALYTGVLAAVIAPIAAILALKSTQNAEPALANASA